MEKKPDKRHVLLGIQPAAWESEVGGAGSRSFWKEGGLVVLWRMACVLRGLTKS